MSVTEKELLTWALIETYSGYQATTEEAIIAERLRRESRMGDVIQ